MPNEPAPSVPDLLKPAYDAIDAAHIRCRELSQRLEVLAGPDVVTALVAYVAAEDEIMTAHAALIVPEYKENTDAAKEAWREANRREYEARQRLLALGRAIRETQRERAEARAQEEGGAANRIRGEATP